MRKRLLGNCELLLLLSMSETMIVQVMTIWQGGCDSPNDVDIQASVGDDSLHERDTQVIEDSHVKFEGLIMTLNHGASPSTSRHFVPPLSMIPACEGMIAHRQGLQDQSLLRVGRCGGGRGKVGRRAGRGSTSIHVVRTRRQGR